MAIAPRAVVGLALLCLMHGAAEDYRIQPASGNRLALEVEKTGLMRGKKHLFLFERYSGSLQYDAQKPAASHIELEIDAASAVLKDEWIGEKDRKKVLEYALHDMWDVANHPKLKFASTRIEPAGEKRFKVHGALVVRGISKPAEVDISLDGSANELKVDGVSAIKMTSYGLKPPSAALGTIGTKDQMTVSFTIRAVSSR